jgi:hypothetical protein
MASPPGGPPFIARDGAPSPPRGRGETPPGHVPHGTSARSRGPPSPLHEPPPPGQEGAPPLAPMAEVRGPPGTFHVEHAPAGRAGSPPARGSFRYRGLSLPPRLRAAAKHRLGTFHVEHPRPEEPLSPSHAPAPSGEAKALPGTFHVEHVPAAHPRRVGRTASRARSTWNIPRPRRCLRVPSFRLPMSRSRVRTGPFRSPWPGTRFGPFHVERVPRKKPARFRCLTGRTRRNRTRLVAGPCSTWNTPPGWPSVGASPILTPFPPRSRAPLRCPPCSTWNVMLPGTRPLLVPLPGAPVSPGPSPFHVEHVRTRASGERRPDARGTGPHLSPCAPSS